MFRWHCLSFMCCATGIVPVASCPVTGHLWREPGSVLLHPPFRYFSTFDEIPRKLCFLHAKQSLLSQSFLRTEMPQSLHLPSHFLDSLQHVHIHLYWTGHSTLGVATAVLKGRIISLNSLATLCLVQPRVTGLLCSEETHWWLVFNLDSTRTPRSFPEKLQCVLGGPKHTLVQGVVPPQVQDLASLLAELNEAPVSPFLQPVKSLWSAAPPSAVPTTPPSLSSSTAQFCSS